MIALLLVKHKDNAQLPRMVDKVFCLPGEHASASCRIKTLHVQNSSKSLLTSNSFSRSNTWRRVRWDVAAKDLHIVLLARGQWQVTRLNMNKTPYHIVHLVSDCWSIKQRFYPLCYSIKWLSKAPVKAGTQTAGQWRAENLRPLRTLILRWSWKKWSGLQGPCGILPFVRGSRGKIYITCVKAFKPRIEFCQKFYTTEFPGQIFYTLKVCKLNISYLSSFFKV